MIFWKILMSCRVYRQRMMPGMMMHCRMHRQWVYRGVYCQWGALLLQMMLKWLWKKALGKMLLARMTTNGPLREKRAQRGSCVAPSPRGLDP